MLAVKVAKQNYIATPEVLVLLEEFRKMVNDGIRIGLVENVTSLFALTKKTYHQLVRYDVSTCYRLTAIGKATGILKNYRKTLRKHPNAKKPYASKIMLTDCYAFRIAEGKLRLPTKSRYYQYIPLNHHVLKSILGHTVRSVTLTASTVSIAFSRETAVTKPTGLIGIDRNLDNVTTADTNSNIKRYDLSKVTRIKTAYRTVKSHFKRNDVRIRTRIFRKYGRLQSNRVNQRLHLVSKQVVSEAKANSQGIVMENLKGIRKLYRKGNGQGTNYRSRLNSWSFYELQRQIEYKAKWEGIPVFYVHPHGTSSHCAVCESKILESTSREVYCPNCKTLVDRDVNAAKNILARALRFKAVGLARNEAVRGNPEQVILRAEASKLIHYTKVNRTTIRL